MTDSTPQVDLDDPYALSALWPAYEPLRERAPVHRLTMPNGEDYWLVSGYRAVATLENDPRFCFNLVTAVPEMAQAYEDALPEWADTFAVNMVTSDPPVHTRLRRLAQPAFAPRLLARMRPRIERVVDDLLADLAERDSFDVMSDFAFPMTTAVVSEFLGFPFADRSRIASWTQALVASATYQQLDELERPYREFTAYLDELFDAKRTTPGEDVISALVHAHDDRDAMTDTELTSTVVLLLGGGFETTIVLLTHGVEALLRHPDQWALLREDQSVARSAVEELLRYGAAGTSPIRYPSEDVELMGVTIPRGAQVMPLYSSANHDPSRFTDPSRLDLTRVDNRHFSFGHGVHYCMGSPLARLEGEIAFTRMATAMPALRLVDPGPDNPRWEDSFPFLRTITSLLVTTRTADR